MKFTSIHEAILNSMSEAVYVVDRKMRIEYANPAAEKLTGYSLADSIGKSCRDIFCEESDLCQDRCPLKRAIQEETPILHRDAETRHKSGAVRQTQISISPFFDGEDCVGRDGVLLKILSDLVELLFDVGRVAPRASIPTGRDKLNAPSKRGWPEANTSVPSVSMLNGCSTGSILTCSLRAPSSLRRPIATRYG